MSDVYPPISSWYLPDAAIAATLGGVRLAGVHGRESGAFWLGVRAETAIISAVVVPKGRGVEEHPGEWRVGADVFGAISYWAKARALTLLGIAHTHPRGVPPRLSWADRHLSVRVPGVLAVVIGNCGDDNSYKDWGWYVFEGGDYRQFDKRELMQRVRRNSEAIELCRADEEGLCLLTS